MTEPCGRCNGAKVVTVMACPGFVPTSIACPTCGGTGVITEERRRWQERGQRLRTARLVRDLSLGEAARRLGARVSELSDAEHGRRDPEPFLSSYVWATIPEKVAP